MKTPVDLGPLKEADVQQLLRFCRPALARIRRECKTWCLCEWLGIANAHIHGNVLQNLNCGPMAAVDLNLIQTIQRCRFRIPSHITEHDMVLHCPVDEAKMRP